MRAPRASLKAVPRARNVSSVVWWSSTGNCVSESRGDVGGGENLLARSPLHRTRRLQPACFAHAWSI